MPKRLTTEEFREQLEKEHPDLELLSEYKGNKNYVTVRCKIHGYTFETKPNWLHCGHGCMKCYQERNGKDRLKSTDKFMDELKEKYPHYDEYDFSKVNYTGRGRKITVICPKHGEFQTTPNKMLWRGDGCKKCGNEKEGLKRRLSMDEFLRRARKTHGWKYDYSKVDYKGVDEKVCIICPKHGEFWQSPYCHLKGHGCPKCNESWMEKSIRLLLDEIEIRYEPQKKFNWLGRMSLDFYLPEYNIGIECQGLQHFEPTEYFGGNEEFRKRLSMDEEKFQKCKEQAIPIVYVADDERFPKNYTDEVFNGKYRNLLRLSEIKNYLINEISSKNVSEMG